MNNQRAYDEIDQLAKLAHRGKELGEPEIAEMLKQARLHKRLNPSQDFIDGMIWYGVMIGQEKALINSAGKLYSWGDIVDHYFISEKGFNRSGLTPEGIGRFKGGEKISSHAIFLRLRDFFGRFVIYKQKSTPSVLALWIMGTYIYQVFRWYGYLWFTSPTRRSGKSICLDLVSSTAFNSTPVMMLPTESYLFREVSANGSTVCLDEIEQLRSKDKEAFGAVMALLNVGFKRGGTVGRSEKIGNQIRPVTFPAYSPKAIAGISNVVDTLEDRSFKIVMLRKKKNELVSRFDTRQWETKLNRLKDDLHLWGLNYGGVISTVYDQPETLEVPEQLDDRAKDIFEPLFAIARMVDGEDPAKSALRELRAFAMDQAGIRESSELDDSIVVQIVSALTTLDLGTSGEQHFTPDQIIECFKAQGVLDAGEKENTNKKRAGSLMKKLGLSSKTERIGGKPLRGYKLTKSIMEDLRERYLHLEEPNTPVESVTPVTLDGKQANNGSVTNGDVTGDVLRAFQANFPTMKVESVTDVTD